MAATSKAIAVVHIDKLDVEHLLVVTKTGFDYVESLL